MSWIDQGRQQHGWFGHGTAPTPPPGELRARAFAIVNFAADEFPSPDDLPFPWEKTVEVLRTLAPILAPDAALKLNEFRLRFFKDTYDPVQAWHLQLFMRDVAASDTHAELVHAGSRLAATISNVGEEGWKLLRVGQWPTFTKHPVRRKCLSPTRMALFRRQLHQCKRRSFRLRCRCHPCRCSCQIAPRTTSGAVMLNN